MKLNYNVIIIEIVLAISTTLVLIYAFYNRENAFPIFATYAITVLVLNIAFSIYNLAFKRRETEVNKEKIKMLINIVNANVVIWSTDFSSVIMNDILMRTIGIDSPRQIKPKAIIDVLFPPDIFTGDRKSAILSNNGEEICISSKNGTDYYTVWNTSVLLDGKNKRYMLSIGWDITEMKRMQQELSISNRKLQTSQSRYALSMELSEIGILLSEHGDDTYYMSIELRQMLGIREHKISIDNFMRRIHPNDKVIFDTYFKSIAKQADDTDIRSLELRILSADKEYHWYLYRYKSVHMGDNIYPTIGGAFLDITKDKEKDLLIEKLAYIDEITEIGNRNKLMLMGQETYECCKELGYSYWVIVLDIDRFHIVNDTCGYSNGNKILRDFAHIMYKYLTFGGFGARIGGDNFALIIKDYGDEELPRKTVEKIQLDFARLAQGMYSTQSFACSAGYSLMPSDGQSFADVLDHAEFALSSGEKKRGSIIGYDRGVHDMIIHGTTLEKALSDAIDNDELELYYQPKIDLNTGLVMGVEALIRWVKPNGEVVLPGKFVPVAETSHLITKISDYVMYEACRQNKLWQEMGLPKIVMSINLTSADFYQKDVKEAIYEILIRTGLEPEWLEVELTESLAMKDIDLAVKQMEALRKMGIKLAMDDFGTGYSSLSYIKIMPITLLKLDRSFITNLEDDEIAKEIVSAIINIAKSKKIETIAEGIETVEQAKILRKAGCNHAQGFLFARPMRARDIADFLEKNQKERKVY